MNESYELLRQGLDTAFIDYTTSSNLAYRPQFVSNDYKEGKKDRNKYASLIAQFCGKPEDAVNHDIERDNYMSAEEALKYGLIDEILIPKRNAHSTNNNK